MISLQVQYSHSSSNNTLFGYVLKVAVTNAVGMPAEIFMFQRGAEPAPTAGAQPQDRFVCIADPVDLDEIPVSAPDLAEEIPYYRLAQVSLAFRCVEDRDETQALISADINKLVETMRLMADTTPTSVVDY